MPIRKEFRKFYQGPAWQATRARILARAGNKCEECGAPDKTLVARIAELPGWWFTMDGHAYDETGAHRGVFRGSEMPEPTFVKIKIGIAHLDHNPENGADENLKALCARCHLIHDQDKHRDTRSIRKDAARPLLGDGHPGDLYL